MRTLTLGCLLLGLCLTVSREAQQMSCGMNPQQPKVGTFSPGDSGSGTGANPRDAESTAEAAMIGVWCAWCPTDPPEQARCAQYYTTWGGGVTTTVSGPDADGNYKSTATATKNGVYSSYCAGC